MNTAMGTKWSGIVFRTITVIALLAFVAASPAWAMKLGQWEAEWKDTKKEFEKSTDKKKPAEKFLGIFRKSSGIESALKKLDKSFKGIDTQKVTPKSVKAFEDALAGFDKTKDAYIKQLEGALSKEKDADSAYAKSLAVLKADLKAISAQASGQLAVFKKAAESGKLSREAFDAGMVKLLVGALKNAKLFIKKVETEKTPDAMKTAFNKGIQKAARDVTQNLTNIVRKMEKSDKRQGAGEKISSVLEQWGNKGRNIDAKANEKAIKKEIKEFEDAIKDASAWAKTLD